MSTQSRLTRPVTFIDIIVQFHKALLPSHSILLYVALTRLSSVVTLITQKLWVFDSISLYASYNSNWSVVAVMTRPQDHRFVSISSCPIRFPNLQRKKNARGSTPFHSAIRHTESHESYTFSSSLLHMYPPPLQRFLPPFSSTSHSLTRITETHGA